MDCQEILSHIDHTLLKPTATWADIQALCQEAVTCRTATVCIPASYLEQARAAFPGLALCTVIGFPLGYTTTQAKCAEAADAVIKGADEVDMVVTQGWVKDGLFDQVTREIAAVKAACGGRPLKVIVETCYLTREEKIALCGCVTRGGADYIKTSTGFGTAGATLEDVELFREHIGPGVSIKAAGGVKTEADLVAFLETGCSRIGTSSAVKLLTGGQAGTY